jgi:hypothetical protein
MGLVAHAEYELRKAGLYDKDSDYNGELAPAIVEVVKKFAELGHSGSSAGISIAILGKLLRFQTLSPITSDPAEWMEVGEGVWQSKREPATFSEDGLKTWYNLDDPEKKNFPARHL